MGGVCPGGPNKHRNAAFHGKCIGFSEKLNKKMCADNKVDESEYPYWHSNKDGLVKHSKIHDSDDLMPATSPRNVATKVPQASSFLGKAGVLGLERAVEVLDTVGSSMLNLNVNSGFTSGIVSRGNKISILAFEVANTIVKGSNLLMSVSEENIQILKKDILHSEGVHQLVSTDMRELLCLSAGDKREEFDVFSREVIRFGNICKDPQWHNLDRFFSKLDSDHATQLHFREKAVATMQGLNTLSQHTSELYHEFQALDRFEHDYHRKVEEMESLHLPPRGESFMILQSELKHQKKLVRSLKKKSLWCKKMEEVVEKLVEIVTFIHQDIVEAFGTTGVIPVNDEPNNAQKTLGKDGLALHYANIIIQIDNIASRPTCIPSNTRDTLYNSLPITVKTALHSQLQSDDSKKELTIPQIKSEMEKTLQWLVPVAVNTTKTHQGFGWVGEWANNCAEFGKGSNVNRIQTLYHANIRKTDQHILQQVACLQRLVVQVKERETGLKPPLPVRFPTWKKQPVNSVTTLIQSFNKYVQLSKEDVGMLENMSWRGVVHVRSKSESFERARVICVDFGLSRSNGSSPRKRTTPVKKCDSILDVMDGLHTF